MSEFWPESVEVKRMGDAFRAMSRMAELRIAMRELTHEQLRIGEREAFEEFRREQGLPPMNP